MPFFSLLLLKLFAGGYKNKIPDMGAGRGDGKREEEGSGVGGPGDRTY